MSLASRVTEFGEFSFRKTVTLFDTITGGVTADLAGHDFLVNPYPYYDQMRPDRMRRSHLVNGWWVFDFDGVQQVLKDTERFSVDPRNTVRFHKSLERSVKARKAAGIYDEASDTPSMLVSDQPDHSRLRRIVTRGFTTSLLEGLTPFIQATADQCIQAARDGRFEVVTQLAEPLPALVIAEMLGVPAEDQQQFREWSTDLIAASGIDNRENQKAADRSSYALALYFRRLIHERPKGLNSDDLLSRLLDAEHEDVLDENEVVSMAILLLLAGHETTTRLISNAVHLLLTHPEQLALLRHDMSLLDNAIDECLRYESPVQTSVRYALSDFTLHGKEIKRGQSLFPFIGAANRDPKANDNPNVFDIRRESIKQVSFGYGIHYCLGVTLARLEARIALTTLLDAFPTMALLSDTPDWSMNPIFRGHNSLPISV